MRDEGRFKLVVGEGDFLVPGTMGRGNLCSQLDMWGSLLVRKQYRGQKVRIQKEGPGAVIPNLGHLSTVLGHLSTVLGFLSMRSV